MGGTRFHILYVKSRPISAFPVVGKHRFQGFGKFEPVLIIFIRKSPLRLGLFWGDGVL